MVTPIRPFIPDLDTLRPAYELVPYEEYSLYFVPGSRVATISSSRGCIHECGFCSQQKFWCRTYRQRTPESFLSEIDLLFQKYGVNTFLFLTPWPYADMYGDLEPFIEVWDLAKYNLVEPVIRPRAMSRQELFQQVIGCYRQFYINKLPQWFELKDDFRRNYLIRSMLVMLKRSFLKEHHGG